MNRHAKDLLQLTRREMDSVSVRFIAQVFENKLEVEGKVADCVRGRRLPIFPEERLLRLQLPRCRKCRPEKGDQARRRRQTCGANVIFRRHEDKDGVAPLLSPNRSNGFTTKRGCDTEYGEVEDIKAPSTEEVSF